MKQCVPRRSALAVATLVTALTALTLPAAGHHSMAMYDTDTPIILQGTVTRIEIRSNHSIFLLTVKDAAGRNQEWIVEAGNSTWGLTTNVNQMPETPILRKLMIGETVQMTGFRERGGAFRAAFTVLRDANGKDIGAIPDPIGPTSKSRG